MIFQPFPKPSIYDFIIDKISLNRRCLSDILYDLVTDDNAEKKVIGSN